MLSFIRDALALMSLHSNRTSTKIGVVPGVGYGCGSPDHVVCLEEYRRLWEFGLKWWLNALSEA